MWEFIKFSLSFFRLPPLLNANNIARLDHTMRLENQALLKADLDDEQRRMVELILSGSLKGLWEDK